MVCYRQFAAINRLVNRDLCYLSRDNGGSSIEYYYYCTKATLVLASLRHTEWAAVCQTHTRKLTSLKGRRLKLEVTWDCWRMKKHKQKKKRQRKRRVWVSAEDYTRDTAKCEKKRDNLSFNLVRLYILFHCNQRLHFYSTILFHHYLVTYTATFSAALFIVCQREGEGAEEAGCENDEN